MGNETARLLVVDADRSHREVLGHRLEGLGYPFVMAEDGGQALALAQAETTELMLLSTTLPDMSAELVLKKLKMDERLSSIVVIMLAPSNTTEGLGQFIELGAEDYLPEPFSPALLKMQLTDYLAVRRRRIAERDRLKQEKLLNDVQIARRFQLDFLPKDVPQPKGWELVACLHPAREVAGDFYDAFSMVQDRRAGIVVADVCDKGVGAALFMALIRSLTRAFAQQNYSLNLMDSLGDDLLPTSGGGRRRGLPSIGVTALKNSVSLTNNYIVDNHADLNMFATMFFGVLDPATGGLVYINGGHNPPFIVGQDGTLKAALKPTGPAVGMLPQAEFQIGQATLDPGDFLVIYTDGVPDARDPAGKQFTDKRLRELLLEPAPSARAQMERIETSLRAHMADAPQFDDITMLIVRRSLSAEL